MKRTTYQFTLSSLIALSLFFSCSKKDLNPENPNINDTGSILQKVSRLGFDTTNVVVNDDFIIVEGDIVLTTANLNKTSPRQASIIDISSPGIYPITYSNQRSLKYYISPTVATWESAIVAAFLKYNTLSNFNLRFTRTTDINQANLKLESGAASGAIAEGYFPANGQIGTRIGINMSTNLTESQKIFTIAHEIGHTIGLRHTNWMAYETQNGVSNGIIVGAYTIPGTPNPSIPAPDGNTNPDPNSIYNSGASMPQIPNWTNFSLYDISALITLYPSFDTAVLTTNPDGSFPVGVNAQIFANVDIPYWREGGLTYEWTVQGVTIQTNSGYSIKVKVTNSNSAAIHCKITNSYGQSLSVSKSFGSIAID